MSGRGWAILAVAAAGAVALAVFQPWQGFGDKPTKARSFRALAAAQAQSAKGPSTAIPTRRPFTATPGVGPPPPPPPSTTLPPPPKGKAGRPHIIIVPVSKSQKRRMEHKFDRVTPMLVLKRRGKGPWVPEKIEISERTEFYAFFIDPRGKYMGKTVVFQWFHRKRKETFARPMSLPVIKMPGYTWPMAFSIIWSAPPSARGLMSFVGYQSVRNRADWDKSRCWGPRLLRVSLFKGYKKGSDGKHVVKIGKTIAEAYFEIHQRGVTIY